ncbi:MAG: hypothetical protein HY300_02330 [Verrucomicrobia bacterium]|nr:hypothetical protein [Verrucomicrobiota bacterium]
MECARLASKLAGVCATIGSIPREYFPPGPGEKSPGNPKQRFDANKWFEVFDRVKPDDGWVLDYAWEFTGVGGVPLLYTRRSSDTPLADPQAWREKFKYPEADAPHLKHLAFEQSAEGAFQFAHFCVETPKFYLHWHSNYRDLELVITRDRLEQILKPIRAEAAHPRMPTNDVINADDRAKLLALDLRPVVRLSGKNAEVTALSFTQWGGFALWRAQLRQPNRFNGARAEELVRYQCNIHY